MRRLLACALAAALITVGCIDVEISIDLNDDGSGTLTTFFAFDRELVEQITGGEASADDLLAEGGIDPDALPEGATLEVIDTDEQVGARITIALEPGDDIEAELDRAFSALGEESGSLTGPGGPFDSFALGRDGDSDGWAFSAVTAQGEEADPLAAMLLRDATFVFRLNLPGEVVEHNAHRVESGGTLAWDIPLTGESTSMFARSEPPGGLSLVLAGIVAAVVLALIVGAFVFLRWRGRRQVEAATEPTL